MGVERERSTYVSMRLRPGFNLDEVRSSLTPLLRQAEVLATDEFRRRSVSHWLYGTGAGAALIAGACLGALVGAVIVGQSLYASTRDHLGEFATLRALGSSAGYINRVISAQSFLCAGIGCALSALVGTFVVWGTADTAMPVVVTPQLAVVILVITFLMCSTGALSAIMKVIRIDPATVFRK
jgi:putative ABC transport system permease protein